MVSGRTRTRGQLYALVAGLIAVGLGSFGYKVLVLGLPLLPGRTAPVWSVTTRISFRTRGDSVRATLRIPASGGGFLVADEAFASRGFGLSTATLGAARQAVWSGTAAAGRHELRYRAVIRRREDVAPISVAGDVPVAPPLPAVARPLLARARVDVADPGRAVRDIVTIVHDGGDRSLVAILGPSPSPARRARLAVDLLAAAGIPARVVHGIDLRAVRRASDSVRAVPFVEWIEVWDRGAWRAHDSGSGAPGIPALYLPWWQGPDSLLRLEGGDGLRVSLTAAMDEEEALASALAELAQTRPRALALSPFALPLPTQRVFRILLLIPVGALIVVILRSVVGIGTFGTFVPVLLALGFRETQLFWGLLLFGIIVGLGLAIRLYLGRLELLVVPRLAAVLIVLVLLMVLVSVLVHGLGVREEISAALFPMVIMTMVVERMSIIWDELGAGDALGQGFGTLVVAALTYLVLTMRVVEHLAFVFPELLLLVLAACLLLGRYTGYRLVELRRFRALGEPA